MSPFSPVRWNPWREMAILMIILMEVSWITPWFKSLAPETYAVDAPRVLIILACIVVFSHLVVRIMDYLHLNKSISQVLMVFFLIIGSFVGIKTMLYPHESLSLSELISHPIRNFADLRSLIPAEFIVIIVVLIGFWRGVSLAQEHIGPSSVKDHFLVGIVMYVVFVFINTIMTGEKSVDFFFLFLFASLVGICAARMTMVGMVRGGKENRFDRSWLLGILLAAFLVVGLSYILGNVIAEQFTWIGILFLTIFGALVVLISIILSPIILFLITILENLTRQSKGLGVLGETLQKLINLMRVLGQKISEIIGKSGIGIMLSRWAPTIKAIILVSIIVLVVLGIVFCMAFKLWKDRERRLASAEEKSNLQSGNIFQSLLDLLRQGWGRALSTSDQVTDLRHRKRIRAAARIRQIYADLIELSESLGHPRPDSQTPLEFMPKLERLFPEFHQEVGMITQAYLGVRYGLLPETQNEVANVETAWKKLQLAGHELLVESKRKKNNKA